MSSMHKKRCSQSETNHTTGDTSIQITIWRKVGVLNLHTNFLPSSFTRQHDLPQSWNYTKGEYESSICDMWNEKKTEYTKEITVSTSFLS